MKKPCACKCHHVSIPRLLSGDGIKPPGIQCCFCISSAVVIKCLSRNNLWEKVFIYLRNSGTVHHCGGVKGLDT